MGETGKVLVDTRPLNEQARAAVQVAKLKSDVMSAIEVLAADPTQTGPLLTSLGAYHFDGPTRQEFLMAAVETRSVVATALVLQEGSSKAARMAAAHLVTQNGVQTLAAAEIAIILLEEGLPEQYRHPDADLPFFVRGKIRNSVEDFIHERYSGADFKPTWSQIDKFSKDEDSLAGIHVVISDMFLKAHPGHEESAAFARYELGAEFRSAHPLYSAFSQLIRQADIVAVKFDADEPQINRIQDLLAKRTHPEDAAASHTAG